MKLLNLVSCFCLNRCYETHPFLYATSDLLEATKLLLLLYANSPFYLNPLLYASSAVLEAVKEIMDCEEKKRLLEAIYV